MNGYIYIYMRDVHKAISLIQILDLSYTLQWASHVQKISEKSESVFLYLSLIGIILRWGFLIWELISIYCGLFVLILVVVVCFLGGSVFLCCFFFHYVSVKFHLWPSSGDLPRPRIGILSLVITAFHSCCLSHHVFDQVNHWPAWVGFETAIFWQCSPGTVETQRLYPLPHGPRRMDFLVL